MSRKLEFRPSAFKHGYTKQDVDAVIYGLLTKTFEAGTGEIGWRLLFVGFNNSPELLEILIECCEDGREVCFHIDKATGESCRLYERA